jgi:nitrogen regulatory protein P-II 1
MKRIDLIISQERIYEVNELLHRHRVGGITFYDIKGRGRGKISPVRAGTGVMRYVLEFGFGTKIEVLVSDSLAKQLVKDIIDSMSTGSASDGKIFVYDAVEAYDIGTKQSGDAAL